MLEKVPILIDSLNRHKVEYIIIGGYAIVLHGFLRATEDIDIVLKMSEENVSKFQAALKELYNDADIDEINFRELNRYSVIRYGTPDNFYIDAISKIGTAFGYNNINKISVEIDGIKYYLAAAESLYEMKKNTYREIDKLDILFLKEKLSDDKEI